MPCEGCQRRTKWIKARFLEAGKGATDWLRRGPHRADLIAESGAIDARTVESVAVRDESQPPEAAP